MHKYLRAIGFSKMNTLEKIKDLAEFVRESADEEAYVSTEHDQGVMLAEYTFFISNHLGICVSGEYDEENHFFAESMIPFFKGNQSTAKGEVSFDRMADKEAYYAVYDDIRAGIGVIFRLQRVIPYLKMRNGRQNFIKKTTISLAGLSTEGKIIFPILKTDKEEIQNRRKWRNRLRWIAVAKCGCEDAIEFVTLNDMNTATTVQKNLRQKKDILTIVDNSFYPYGLECDHYAIIGDIRDCMLVPNFYTGERIWMMTLEVNEMIFDICINAEDLEGEPMVGRRFKGIIWLQGTVHFPE